MGSRTGLPCGGPGQWAPCVHQHTPAVASGLVTLHWLVESPGGALRDDNALTGILPGLFQGALPLLVTRMDLLCKRRCSLWALSLPWLIIAVSRTRVQPVPKELMAGASPRRAAAPTPGLQLGDGSGGGWRPRTRLQPRTARAR